MAVAPISLIPPSITINLEQGNFTVSSAPGAPAVTVKRVRGFDGAPDAYAPPVDSPPHRPLPGFHSRDRINNATNPVPPTFHANGVNTILWAGIVSKTQAEANPQHLKVDNRLFLRDQAQRFPVQLRVCLSTELEITDVGSAR
jgi:hypothetical protein